MAFWGFLGGASCLDEQIDKQIVMLSGSHKRLLLQEPAKLDWLLWMTKGMLHFQSKPRYALHYSPISHERSWFAFAFLTARLRLHLEPRALAAIRISRENACRC